MGKIFLILIPNLSKNMLKIRKIIPKIRKIFLILISNLSKNMLKIRKLFLK